MFYKDNYVVRCRIYTPLILPLKDIRSVPAIYNYTIEYPSE